MTNNKINPKSKLQKYKKEIGWLLKEKYCLNVIPDLIGDPSTNSWIPASAGMTPEIVENIKADINRIVNGEPVDYVIGFKEFLNCKIDLSKKPLIPRVETEFWVQSILQDSKFKIQNSKVLDLCCGSGCIGISLLKNVPNCNITFADISDIALAQTRINCDLNFPSGHPGRSIATDRILRIDSICPIKSDLQNDRETVTYKIIKSDLFEDLKGQKFDFIFTNPPYVKNKDIKGSLLYEPRLALDGFGTDGLEIIYKILKDFSRYLNPGGKLFLEFGYGQKQKIENFLKSPINQLPITNWSYHKDQFDKFRFFVISC